MPKGCQSTSASSQSVGSRHSLPGAARPAFSSLTLQRSTQPTVFKERHGSRWRRELWSIPVQDKCGREKDGLQSVTFHCFLSTNLQDQVPHRSFVWPVIRKTGLWVQSVCQHGWGLWRQNKPLMMAKSFCSWESQCKLHPGSPGVLKNALLTGLSTSGDKRAWRSLNQMHVAYWNNLNSHLGSNWDKLIRFF